MAEMTVLEGHAWGTLGHECARLLESMPKPTIAAVNGFGARRRLRARARCDIRYARRTRSSANRRSTWP